MLKRWFAGICCCFRRGRRGGRGPSGSGTLGADFWSMKGSYFAIERGQLFCLLGPNGAGAYTPLRCASLTLRDPMQQIVMVALCMACFVLPVTVDYTHLHILLSC